MYPAAKNPTRPILAQEIKESVEILRLFDENREWKHRFAIKIQTTSGSVILFLSSRSQGPGDR